MDESRLREMARKAIQDGKLPNRPPERMWGGPGVDVNCIICDKSVTPEEYEFKLEFAQREGEPGAGNHHATSDASQPGSSSARMWTWSTAKPCQR